MANPKIVDRCFVALDLTAGTYKWCACGQSKNQPFCDGSHSGTEFVPKTLELKQDARVRFCLCKHTKSKDGTCDGSHNNLD